MTASTPRQRLVDTATALLEREGPAAVTIRRVAREAGVSHGAPLRHFPSLAALLSAIAARGFVELAADVQAAVRDAQDPTPTGRLAAAAHGYVRFALKHRGVFELMFRSEVLDLGDPALAEAGMGAFEDLVTLVADAQATGWQAQADAREVAGVVWATVHGLAQLWLWGAYEGATGVTDVARAVDLVPQLMSIEEGSP